METTTTTTMMMPAPLKLSTDRHAHTLTLRDYTKPFTCDRCSCPGGGGPRYRCDECEVEFHAPCVTCPETLPFFMHPDHPLHLEKSRNPFDQLRHCDVCGDHVKGFYYRCKACAVEVHPVCAALRPEISDGAHPEHELTYTNLKGKKVLCSVCEVDCEGWRYVCGQCDVHVHMRCLHVNRQEEAGAEEKGGGGKGHSKEILAGSLIVLKVVAAVLKAAGE